MAGELRRLLLGILPRVAALSAAAGEADALAFERIDEPIALAVDYQPHLHANFERRVGARTAL
ncbi:MAG: hypothetical protein ACREV7_21615 [Steroidobacteraceae bacterium]